MPDDMSFLDADQYPDRPDTPDFWRLSKTVLSLDAKADEDNTPPPVILGEVVDFPSFEYFAKQRMTTALARIGLPVEFMPVALAIFYDAFGIGAFYVEETQREFFADLASKMTKPADVFGPIKIPYTPNTIDLAKKWMTDNIIDLFEAEIANERDGGHSPATISSTIDSVSQAPEIMCEGWLPSDFVALLQIADVVGVNTEVRDLL